jgi:hypothetical protein
MKRALIIHQMIVAFTALLIGPLIFTPVHAKTSIPETANLSANGEAMTKPVARNEAQNRSRIVPSQLGVCALELIKLERGRLAVCSDTNLAYSGILLDCTDLDGAKAATCEAATRTMPNLGKRKQVVPTAPSK